MVMLSLLLLSCVVSSLTAAISDVSTTGSQRDDPISVLLVAQTDTSHVLMMSAIGEALVLRGHNVTLCTTEREGTDLPRQLAKRLGMAFLSAGPDSQPTLQGKLLDESIADNYKLLPRSESQEKFAENPRKIATKLLSNPSAWDIVLADRQSSTAAVCPSLKWGVPFILLELTNDYVNLPPWAYPIFPLGYTDNLTFSQRLLFTLYRPIYKYLLSKIDTYRIESLPSICSQYSDHMHNIVTGYFPVIHGTAIGFDYSHPVLPMMHFVGPLTVTSEETPSRDLESWLGKKTNKSTIFISMGSVTRLTTAMGSALVNGILQTNYNVVWSLRENNRNILEGLSLSKERFYISAWIPAVQQVMRHKAIAMAILHAGSGGVHASLNNGIPLIVIPYTYDQYETAARVENAGVGVRLDGPSMTADMIQNALETVASPKYRKVAEKMQKIFHQAGGAEKAAKLVEFYKEVGYDHLVPAYLKYKWSWVQYYNVDVNILLLVAAIVLVILTYRSCHFIWIICSAVIKKEKTA